MAKTETKDEGKQVAPPQDDKTKALAIATAYDEDAGGGFEGADNSDYLVPILDVLQAQSPEIASGTIEGAKPGDFIIRALGMTFDGKKGVVFVPCARQHKFVEWVPREKGGGVAGQYDPDEPYVTKAKAGQEFGKIKLENENDLVETFYVYAQLVNGDEVITVSIPFTSTKINRYKGMMTKARAILVKLPDGRRISPPLWAHRFVMKTEFIEKKGYKWHNVQINFDGKTADDARIDPTSDLYQSARAISKLVESGIAKADTSKETGSAGSDDGEPSAGGDRGSKEVPF